MTIVDYILMAAILAGAGYLLYHSVWKKKGHCPNCSGGACHRRSINL